MKVMFLFQGLPHYYNYVLNRIHGIENLEVINVVPSNPVNIGEGVFISHQDIQYTLYELEECRGRIKGFFFRSLWKVIFKEKPDIIVVSDAHLRGYLFDLPTFFTTRLLGIRLILKSIPFRVPKYNEARAGLKPYSRRFIQLWLRGFLWRLPDAHVNYIDEAFDIYGSYGVSPEKIFITYNSPDTDRLLEVHDRLLSEVGDKGARSHRLIHVGRLIEWKRVDLLLLAVAKLKKKYADIELLILGDGPKASEWQHLARLLGIQNSVEFRGGVYEPMQIGRYLLSSAIYVLAGMGGLSINDAMCFGRPIVCSVCDGTEKYLVKNGVNGLFFNEGNAESLYEKIDFLFTHPERCIQMGQKSLEIIRNEINIYTVIRGYVRAFEYVTSKRVCFKV
jgi:glycosyltransferase involved in cell wall biosynthesis